MTTTYDGLTTWVHESMLRSRAQYDAQQAATRPPTKPYKKGDRIIFKVPAFPHNELGVIRKMTTWEQYPGEPCYEIFSSRTIPHWWVKRLAPPEDPGFFFPGM